MALGRILMTWGSVALIAGCAATKQASTVETVGLSRQRHLRIAPAWPRSGQAVLGYVNEDANFAKYDKIILEPVTIWGDPETPDIAARRPRHACEHNLHRFLRRAGQGL